MVVIGSLRAAEPMPAEFRSDAAAVIAAAQAADRTRYPDAHFVLLDDRIHTRYEADGSDVTWDEEWEKVLDEPGRKALATLTLPVNRRTSDAEIQLVEIVGADGKVRTVDFAKTLKEATDNSSMGANIYDPLDKVISCALPGLAVGETRHVITCRRLLKPRMKGAWCDINMLEDASPIAATTITVDAPKELPLVHAELRHPISNTVTRTERTLPDGRVLHRWEVRDVPQYFPEPRMPSARNCVQALFVSTLRDWRETSKWYWSMCVDHLAKTNADIVAKVDELHRTATGYALADRAKLGAAEEQALLRAVYRFVSQEIRYMGLTLEDTAPGYEPHDVDITFANRYGVCRDKAGLLVAMLRVAGFNAFPVLINYGAKQDPVVPSPYFNHAIVAVENVRNPGSGAPYTLLDPTDEQSKDLMPTYLSNLSYLVARPEGEDLLTTPAPDYRANLMDVRTEVKIRPDGDGTVRYRVVFNGLTDNMIRSRFVGMRPYLRRNQFLQMLKAGGLDNAELLDFRMLPEDLKDTETTLSVDFSIRTSGLLRRGETADVLAVPYFTGYYNYVARTLAPAFALEKRRFPLKFTSTLGVREEVSVDYESATGRPLPFPPDIDLGGATGYSIVRRAERKAGHLELVREEKLTELELSAEDYAAARKLREDAELAEKDEYRFAAVSERESDLSVALSRNVYDFRSPRSWKRTVTTEKTVLTVVGKKTYSEIELGYDERVGTAELVSGVVSNRDGSVHLVTEKEINVMDAGGVAEAPRYAGGKLKVVNLPSVEVGSVLSTVTERDYTNAPAAFCERFAFVTKDVIDRREYVFNFPAGMDFTLQTYNLPWPGIELSCVTNADGSVRLEVSAGRLPPVRNEWGHPIWIRYEPGFAVSCRPAADFTRRYAAALRRARAEGSEKAAAKAKELVKDVENPAEKLETLRRWLAHNVRSVGVGSVFSAPVEDVVFPPDRSIADGYASAGDRMNLFQAMLEAAGFEVEPLLVSGFEDEDDRYDAVFREQAGDIAPYRSLVLKAVWTTGFWPFSRSETFYAENGSSEYVPARCYDCGGHRAFSLASFEYLDVPEPAPDWRKAETERTVYDLAEDGTARISSRTVERGAGIASSRRFFREVTPEKKRRVEQQLAASQARNAVVTKPLSADAEGYPFTMEYAIESAGFARVQDGTMTISLPSLSTDFLPTTGSATRRLDLLLGAASETVDERVVVFPAGWTEPESLPESFAWRFPGEKEPWVKYDVSRRIREDGRLEVTLRWRRRIPEGRTLDRSFADYFSAQQLFLNSPSLRVISARRGAK